MTQIKLSNSNSNEAISFDDCEALTNEGRYGFVNKTKAQSCQEQYPEIFVAKYTGKRQVKLWYVTTTWSHWAGNIYKNFSS